ncbi:hypothetical protein HYT55_02300 [Candidatus Woesearchaeota archaeon]|nr:hypothetical protein [Candidatus Woesearchaeota archaeon]
MSLLSKIKNITIATAVVGGVLGLHRLAADTVYDGMHSEISSPFGRKPNLHERYGESSGEEEIGLFDTLYYTLMWRTDSREVHATLYLDRAFSREKDVSLYCSLAEEIRCFPISDPIPSNEYVLSLSGEQIQALGERYIKEADLREVRERIIKNGSAF